MNHLLQKTKSKLAGVALVSIAIALLVSFGACSNTKGDNNQSPTIALRINEYQLHNENTLRNVLWNTPDWIELYNYSDMPIWLGDKYLSDDSKNPIKYRLPDMILDANSYLVVYASGQKANIDGEVHIPFKLSESDGDIMLSTSNNYIIDVCLMNEMAADISTGVNANGSWVYFATPTPGKANGSDYSKRNDIEAVAIEILPIVINEYMSSNTYTLKDKDGASSDWIELYNPNDVDVDLYNYYISDDAASKGKFRLPEYTLGANEYVVIYASGAKEVYLDEIHTSFSIGKKDVK